jgi:hypothetical protein
MKKFKPLEMKECPFTNLPEKKAGRWGAGLTPAKMADCRWLNPVLVGQFEFLEWTGEKICASYCTSSWAGGSSDQTVRREKSSSSRLLS